MDGWLLKMPPKQADRKRQRADDTTAVSSFDPLQLTINGARLAAQAMYELRALKAQLAVFALVSKQWPPSSKLLQHALTCSSLSTSQRARQMWAALCLQVLELPLPEGDLHVLRKHVQETTSCTALEGLVTECQVWSTKSGQLAFSLMSKPRLDEPLGVIVRALRAASAVIRFTSAPPKPLEREVQDGIRRAGLFLQRRPANRPCRILPAPLFAVMI
eukprot:TRINITY_DN51757_c0_g1_i1.p1 TRINITY_DN51757_c0_g1~~TRINITY_DN51757_c0_g1_i1.p1  ORF type:complete len:217 (+),score=10.22 TRINITY_DN51757_c0_g1_i1:28-678(+)